MEKELYAHLPAEVKEYIINTGEVIINCIDCTGEKLACKSECCLGIKLKCPHNCCPNKKRCTDHLEGFLGKERLHGRDFLSPGK